MMRADGISRKPGAGKMAKSAKTFTYWVDIVGACNLRCPSCPRGNFMPGDVIKESPPSGLMAFDLFKDIVRKIKRDGPSLNPQIHLYNWGEPLVHPEIGKFIRHVLDEGIYCGVSSNLNYDGTLRDVIQAGPDFFRVSLSGFYQENYGRTHTRGDIERVKRNMRKLRDYMTEFDKNIYVEVNYHIYRHNAGRDLEDMIAFCNDLRFNIGPVWAFFQPLEKNFDLIDGKLSEADRKLLDLYAIRPEEAMKLSMPYKDQDCPVRKWATVINYNGTVPLCCNTFDQNYIVADSFLDIDHEVLQARKYAHSACKTCMDNAIHVYLAYGAGPVMDEVGNKVLRDIGNPLEVYQYATPHVVSREKGPLPILARTERELGQRKKIRGMRAFWWRIREMSRRAAGF